MYNYENQMRIDILDYFECGDGNWIIEKSNDFEDFLQNCYDDCFVNDSITGNASGSYTFNSFEAMEYVNDNHDLLNEALKEFCVDSETITEKFLNGDYEYFDVTIRCYILSHVLSSLENELEEIYNNYKEAEK